MLLQNLFSYILKLKQSLADFWCLELDGQLTNVSQVTKEHTYLSTFEVPKLESVQQWITADQNRGFDQLIAFPLPTTVVPAYSAVYLCHTER